VVIKDCVPIQNFLPRLVTVEFSYDRDVIFFDNIYLMAGRPRQHILETESRQALSSILPSEWVPTTPQHDYGIDLQFQIFKSGASTPYFFFVQLKATDKKINEKNGPSYSFSVERLLEYEEYPLPVLLIVYYAKEKRFFFRWTHFLLAKEAIVKKTNLKTRKNLMVHFETELSAENSEVLLTEDLKEYFFLNELRSENEETFKVTLKLNIDETLRKQMETQLKEWLWRNKNFDFIQIGNSDHADLYIEGIDEWNALTATLKSKTIVNPFLEDPTEGNFPQSTLAALKMVLADSLGHTGRRNTALDMITQYIHYAYPTNSTASFIFSQPSWAIQYTMSKRNLEALEIADTLVNSDTPDLGYFLAFISQLKGADFLVRKKYRDFCIRRVETAHNNKEKGIQSYNLANAWGCEEFFRQAVINYCKAAKYEPRYLEKSYWWAEMAGCLFLMDKYAWAEHCYRKSVELGEERIPARYLLGDSLLHQGKFEEALKELTIYLSETERPCAGAILQKWLADFLLAKFGNSKRNTTKSNELIERALGIEDVKKQTEVLFKALQYDPLSGLAWYNYRISESEASNTKNFHFWLASVLTNPNDIRSWAYFILLMFFEFSEKMKFQNLHFAIIAEAWKNKTRIEDEIRKILPKESLTTFFQLIETLTEEAEKLFLQKSPILRRPF